MTATELELIYAQLVAERGVPGQDIPACPGGDEHATQAIGVHRLLAGGDGQQAPTDQGTH